MGCWLAGKLMKSWAGKRLAYLALVLNLFAWQTSRGNVPQRLGQPLYKQAVPAVAVTLSN